MAGRLFGDGDGVVFTDFTKSRDVIAHELTHGMTEFSAGADPRVAGDPSRTAHLLLPSSPWAIYWFYR
jgi:Thermolysin metallopeptidase, catalytic domain